MNLLDYRALSATACGRITQMRRILHTKDDKILKLETKPLSINVTYKETFLDSNCNHLLSLVDRKPEVLEWFRVCSHEKGCSRVNISTNFLKTYPVYNCCKVAFAFASGDLK